MIEVSPITAFMTYLGITLCSLLIVWGYSHYVGRKKKLTLPQQKLLVCEYCHFCYLKDISKKITRCPQCHSFNKN